MAIKLQHENVQESEFSKDGCKTHILYHPIRDCHISILLKIQYILSLLTTSRFSKKKKKKKKSQLTSNLVRFIYGY